MSLDIAAANTFNSSDEGRYADPRDNPQDQRILHPSPHSDVWKADFDPAKVGVKPGDAIHTAVALH